MAHRTKQLYEDVTRTIIQLLGQQLETWDKPWIGLDGEGRMAYNALTGRTYRSTNQLILSLATSREGYPKNGWMTFRQIKSLGGHVTKGSRATRIHFWSFVYQDEDGKTIPDSKVEDISPDILSATGIRRVPVFKVFSVFNVAQTAELPDRFYELETFTEPTEVTKNTFAENLLEATGAKISHTDRGRACYRPDRDEIELPHLEHFRGEDRYYETIFHELAHWTSHETRLDRDIRNVFGTREYAFEELIAELSSAILCASLGYSASITRNAAYIKTWIEILEDDHSFIFKASRHAERAVDYIIGLRSGL